MDQSAYKPLKARKTATQARSRVTVDAIFEATIQVLLITGYDKLTTTLVAERAGVSVGSLYQYYPNKHALMAAVIERHLSGVVVQVERACEAAIDVPLSEAIERVCDAFVDAKIERVDVSRALYGPSADLGGAGLVKMMTLRAAQAVMQLVYARPELTLDQPELKVLFLLTSMVGPVQAVIEMDAGPEMVAALRQHLKTMARSMLH